MNIVTIAGGMGIRMCPCKEPLKVKETSGCQACWHCGKCGKHGGCDNITNMAILDRYYEEQKARQCE